MAEDGDGEERHQVVDHAESGDEGGAREDVNGGGYEEAGERGQVREEDAPSLGIADAGDQLDGCVDDVKNKKADEEGPERRTEEGSAFLWPRGRRRVHTLAKVPAEAAQGKHELEGILRPRRKESGVLTFACCCRCRRRGQVVLRRIGIRVDRVVLGRGGCGSDGRSGHGAWDELALLVSTCPGEGEIDALADEHEGEGGGAPVEHVVSRFEEDEAV